MLEIIKKRIIKLIKHDSYTPVKVSELAKSLGVPEVNYPRFEEAFEQLKDAGHVVIGPGALVTLPTMANRITGTFRANSKGFGFIVPLESNSYGDLFVAGKDAGGAMNGDIVSAKVIKQGKKEGQIRYGGIITEILERSSNKLVGTLQKDNQGWFIRPDGSAFLYPIYIDDVTAKNARLKDKVVVEIVSYQSGGSFATGVIIEVLGKAGRYDSEIKAVMRQYNLPENFDDVCLKQATKLAADFSADNDHGRQDITDKVIVTIDPPDSKDFDDAISIEKDSQGRFVLGVHIADVSCFVRQDTPLDTEAAERGNSTYLPGWTIPMLPEVLSNGICSLQPGKKRFAKSAYITYDDAGKVVSTSFANSIIASTQRLTYLQADGALKGKTKDIKPEVLLLLSDMEKLSRIIEKRRMSQGMLHLDIPDIELVSDEAGQVIDANPADDSYPHTIIEMFMVEANEAVASFLDRKKITFIRRIHPDPDALTMAGLSKLVKVFGYSLPKKPNRFDLQQLLDSVKKTDSSTAINLLVLRSFEKAVYSPLNIGHYALASKNYGHFTSPIRRYADLVVHRLLQSCIDARGKSSVDISPDQLNDVSRHISYTEQRSAQAENELKKVLILQMLSKKIGSEFNGVITGVAGFGVFVQCIKFGIEGLIKLEDLGDDKWEYNQKYQCIVGQRSGRTITLGQPLKVRIVSVNVEARKLDIIPAEPMVTKAARAEKTGKKPAKKANKRRPRKRYGKRKH
ncbi:MAG TPA: ribonuclease R [Sedimentisphaerales bacterium]|nr:ribonuclease R [Sedimentisphaerales bacterium]